MKHPNNIFMSSDFYNVARHYSRDVYPHHYLSARYVDDIIDRALDILYHLEKRNIGLEEQEEILAAIEILEYE